MTSDLLGYDGDGVTTVVGTATAIQDTADTDAQLLT